MAALISTQTGADVELVEGDRGEFTVWVGDRIVARKDGHDFPTDEDAAAAVTRALSAEP